MVFVNKKMALKKKQLVSKEKKKKQKEKEEMVLIEMSPDETDPTQSWEATKPGPEWLEG